MPNETNAVSLRRSKRQQGIDVTPREIRTAKRVKKPAEPVGEQISRKRNEEGEEQEVREVQEEGEYEDDEEHNVDEEDGEENDAEQDDSVRDSVEACVTEQSNNKNKRTRGPTRMRKVAKSHEDKVEVEFNSLGDHVGKGSVTLSSFIGPLVREHVPVLVDDWRRLDEKTKETLWEEIQGRFNLTEEWQKNCVFRQMGCVWRASKSRLVNKLRSTRSKEKLRSLKPSNIHNVGAWVKWVKSRTGPSFKERSDKFRDLRKNQIPHTTSRKGMTRLAHEMKKKASDPTKITRSKVWIAGHTHADGRPVRPEFEQTIEQIKSIDSEMGSTSNASVKEDAVSQILGKDKSGRVRGMGRGMTASKLELLMARDAHVQKIEARQAELVNEIEDLKQVVRDLAAGKRNQQPDCSQSSTPGASRGGPRCQILDWYSDEEVVVGEGEVCSVDATYKIGRIPIGPNAAAVIVNFASDTDAYVWRPTTSINTIGKAVGTIIAWPFDKLILDNLESPTVNKTAGSGTNAFHDRLNLLAWNSDHEVIAEGHLTSTDPKQMVNKIPLGPNAALVMIDKVINKDAYLWRPSEDMTVMGDALFQNIPWPITKVLLSNVEPTEEASQHSKFADFSQRAGPAVCKDSEPPKQSSPKSASTSSNSSSASKKKCFLLDCSGSGKKVAEGRVCSTDPKETVHFVPLGPNASKVWVDVVKIGDVRVWRPNSEVEIIADALGTTVAWPSDKIVFM